jgi:hypothetical protein
MIPLQPNFEMGDYIKLNLGGTKDSIKNSFRGYKERVEKRGMPLT